MFKGNKKMNTASNTTAVKSKGKENPSKRDVFPWRLLIALMVIIVLGPWLSLEIRTFLAELIPFASYHSWILAAISLLLMGGSAWILHHKRMQHGKILGWGIFALVSGHWLALEGEGYLNRIYLHYSIKIPIAFLILFAAGSYFLKRKGSLEMVRNLRKRQSKDLSDDESIQGLILLVSKPNYVPEIGDESESFHVRLVSDEKRIVEKNIRVVELQGNDIESHIDQLNEPWKWNWQQLLRAIKHHKDLKQIWLIGTPDKAFEPDPKSSHLGLKDKPNHDSAVGNISVPAPSVVPSNHYGSGRYLCLCQLFLKPYLPPNTKICHAPDVDFEDFEKLQNALKKIITIEMKDIASNRIAVDVTGGLKTASIVGGVLTLNRETVIQYVQTERPFEAKIYDMRWDRPRLSFE
jgi:hypothetical protein